MANPASDTWSQSESEGGASWIDRVKLQPPQPAVADNLARSATLSWPVAPDAFIEEVVQILTLMGSSSSKHPRPAAADASPHPVLHLRTGNVEVLSLPRLAQLYDAITAASHHRCLDVVTKSHFNVAASMIAKRTTNHCCLSGVCGGDRCPFAFVPLDACHVFLKHGMCSARHCRYTHYVLALRLETMTMYVFRAALSVGQAAAISPSVVLLTKSARLELLAVVREAVAARSRATACAFQSHARDAARCANARAVNQARNASVADVIAEERRRIVLEDELEALIGGRDEREPPSSRHRSESHTSSGLLL